MSTTTDSPIWKEFVKQHEHSPMWLLLKRIKPFIRYKLYKSLVHVYYFNLSTLAALFGTDKLSHGYTIHYQPLLSSLRNKHFNMLEVGIGGYEHPDQGGESLQMWKAFFRHANIHGLDFYDKSKFQGKRVTIWQGSQTDRNLLEQIANISGGLDLAIDDGSHQNQHVIETFKILFPLINKGGVYIVEDTQTSYWLEYGGKSCKNDNTESTTMGYFKTLVDGLNYTELRFKDYEPTYFDKNIESILFYHNLVVIRKVKDDVNTAQ